MGVRILVAASDNDSLYEYAILYCSTAMWAFGPVISGTVYESALERAERFCAYVRSTYGCDPRRLTDADLTAAWSDFPALVTDDDDDTNDSKE